MRPTEAADVEDPAAAAATCTVRGAPLKPDQRPVPIRLAARGGIFWCGTPTRQRRSHCQSHHHWSMMAT